MSFGKAISVPFAIALILLVAAAAAGPQKGKDPARVHFDQGVKLYEDGQYEQAAIAFARAYEIKPSYKILFNIGQAEAELEHYALALDAFTRYLAEGGAEVPPERVQLVKSEVERLNVLVGMVNIQCAIEGAKIRIDNETIGETPIAGPFFVDIGKHEVVVSKGQDELLREIVRVAGGQTITLEVGLEQAAAVAPADGGESEPAQEAAEPEPKDEGGKKRVWTWVALGVGAAVGIAGGAVGGAAMARKNSLEEECAGNHCLQSSKGEADAIRTMNLTADILYGVAGAAAVTALILFFVEPDDEPQAAVAVTPAVTAAGAGLMVGGRF